MILREVYMSKNYRADLVHGYYARYIGDGIFRIVEASAPRTALAKKIGCSGPTIREYDTDGTELPLELRNKCIQGTYTMERFYPK